MKRGKTRSQERLGRDPREPPRVVADAQVVEQARHMARTLRREAVHVLGLCPVDHGCAVLPAAVQLASALADQSGTPVALIDLNARWRALPEVKAAPGGSLLRTRWLGGERGGGERVALLSLSEEATVGAGLLEGERLLQSGRQMFDHILVDLTGLEQLGEHLATAALCDALVLVARAGLTKDNTLERLYHAFSAQRILGVILTGMKT